MSRKAVITVNRPREDVMRLWEASEHRPEYIAGADAAVTFLEAPGQRGTEIHVALPKAPAGKLGEVVGKVRGGDARAKAMDELRRFKQLVETGVIARSEGTPEGEKAERKLKQRPAQPPDDSEREKAEA